MLRIALVGFGNVGKGALDALMDAPDMTLACVVEAASVPPAHGLEDKWITDIADISRFAPIDAAVLALPSRMCPDAASRLLAMGINTVDAFDIHTDIVKTRKSLDAVAKQHGKAAVLSSGWDPGSDSILRALFEAMAPRGLSYTDFGPGMSMGHSVAAKAIDGVENALSMTIPAGSGVHRRMVYVQLKPGADFARVAADLKADAYFAHDDTHVEQVADVSALLDVGHGVHMTRKGVSGKAHNQQLCFDMRINNPALTGQMLVASARAVVKRAPGCYTLPEIPVIDFLPGDIDELIGRLV